VATWRAFEVPRGTSYIPSKNGELCLVTRPAGRFLVSRRAVPSRHHSFPHRNQKPACRPANVAERLVLAEGALKNHVSNTLGKLQAENRTQAADIARRHGLI
jgi:hypothetical protein